MGRDRFIYMNNKMIKKKTFLSEKSITEIIPKNFSNTFKDKKFGIGENVQPPKDLSRFIKWPKYIKIQRQRKIFSKKLKIPPSIFQFTRTLDRNLTKQVFELLFKYKVSKKIEKETKISVKPSKNNEKTKFLLKHGIRTVTNLIIKKKAFFVIIAHDVNPIECVIWLPALCNKFNIPFSIIKNKSRMGQLVNRKKTSCIAMVMHDVSSINLEIGKIVDTFRIHFNNHFVETMSRWGGL
jgi:large subunit ribosomal protein L7Ae